MSKFIVDIELDGYDTEQEAENACLEFIKDQLDITASSVKVEPLKEIYLLSEYSECYAEESNIGICFSKEKADTLVTKFSNEGATCKSCGAKNSYHKMIIKEVC